MAISTSIIIAKKKATRNAENNKKVENVENIKNTKNDENDEYLEINLV